MRAQIRALWRAVPAALVLAGCSGGEDGGGGGSTAGAGGSGAADASEDVPTTTDAGAGGDSTTSWDAGLDSSEGGMGTPCTAEARRIYLVTDDSELVAFDPDAYTFDVIGTLTCGSPALPRAMTIDRAGVGWTVFTDQTLHKFSTVDAKCETVGALVGDDDFGVFGMAMSTDEPGGSAETLYTAGSTYAGLGWLDTSTREVEPIATYPETSGVADLTGTGDARLWAFFRKTPAVIVELDKSTAGEIHRYELPGVDTGAAWAFAFWGGSLWLFTWPPGRATSSLTMFDPSDESILEVENELGFVVTGAGVSTCAPVQKPK